MLSGSGSETDAPPRHWSRGPDGSRVRNIADILRRRVAATPDAPALLQGDHVTTYGQLDARSSQVAQALLAAGVAAGDRVAYIGVNAPSFLEVLYGAAKIGAIATALNNRLLAPETARHPDQRRAGGAGAGRGRTRARGR